MRLKGVDVMIPRFIICSSPRSGTNLLRHLLLQYGIGVPVEIHPDYLSFEKRPVELVESAYRVEYLYNFLKGVNFIPAHLEQRKKQVGSMPTEHTSKSFSRIVWDFQFHEVIANLRKVAPVRDEIKDNELLGYLFPTIKYIYLYRRDKINQSVSIEMARQSNQWLVRNIDNFGEYQSYSYDFGKIAQELTWRMDAEVRWKDIFEVFGIRPLEICHEDFLDDMTSSIIQISDYLGIPIKNASTEETQRKLKHDDSPVKQSSPTKDEWIRLARRDFGRVKGYINENE